MTRSLQLYIAGLVVISTVLLIATSSSFGADPAIAINLTGDAVVTQPEVALGIAFWIVVTLFASALPVRMPRGMLVAVSIAPVLAASVTRAARLSAHGSP